MNEITYQTRVRRRRGRWHVSVPSLPADAPVVVTDKLANADVLMIEQLANYLGCNVNSIGVEVRHPVTKPRQSLRSRVTSSSVQAWGALATLGGVYLAAGLAATLIVSGVLVTTLGVLKESGRI